MKTVTKRTRKSSKKETAQVNVTPNPIVSTDSDWRFVKAKFDGKCDITGFNIKVGDWIAYNVNTKKVVKSIRMEQKRIPEYFEKTDGFIFNTLKRYVSTVTETKIENSFIEEFVSESMPSMLEEFKTEFFYLHQLNEDSIRYYFFGQL